MVTVYWKKTQKTPQHDLPLFSNWDQEPLNNINSNSNIPGKALINLLTFTYSMCMFYLSALSSFSSLRVWCICCIEYVESHIMYTFYGQTCKKCTFYGWTVEWMYSIVDAIQCVHSPACGHGMYKFYSLLYSMHTLCIFYISICTMCTFYGIFNNFTRVFYTKVFHQVDQGVDTIYANKVWRVDDS